MTSYLRKRNCFIFILLAGAGLTAYVTNGPSLEPPSAPKHINHTPPLKRAKHPWWSSDTCYGWFCFYPFLESRVTNYFIVIFFFIFLVWFIHRRVTKKIDDQITRAHLNDEGKGLV